MASHAPVSLRIVVLGILFHHCGALLRLNPLVKTKLGWIEGLSDEDCNCSMFMGIPFAQVNSSNPFGASIPQKPFDNTFLAHDDSARCPQIEEFNNTYTGSLDCLHINIYVPGTTKPKGQLPVLVSIYGGDFKIGFSGRYIYGPRFLTRHGIILVTFNYRLGPYGFMCLNSPEVPGNQGLKDQLQALKWIKNNIEAFGGDSNKITLIGVSTGAMCADALAIFSKEKLFHQIILESGSSIMPIYSKPEINAPKKLASYLGVDISSNDEALDYLSTVEPSKIIMASSQLKLNFRLCVEKEFDGVERFADENWKNKKVPNINGITALIGYTKDELFFLYAESPRFFYNCSNLIMRTMSYDFDVEHPDFVGMIDTVKHFYIGDGNETDRNNRYDVSAFESDFRFIHPIHRTINRYFANNASKIFHYMFSYDGKRNFLKQKMSINEPCVVHADEIGYLFDISYLKGSISNEDRFMIDRLTTLWANFVKYGNPTPNTSPLLPVRWLPITEDSPFYCMDINLEMKLKTRNFNKRMAFWDLFYKANEKLQTIYLHLNSKCKNDICFCYCNIQ
ncbi:hypothetical protein ACJJTC_007532 [Scirpophaga incertulas]